MRLIDADKIRFGKVIDAVLHNSGIPVLKETSIGDIPTAYDVDKVVEELEKMKKRNPFIDNVKDNSIEASVSRQTLDYAIEIVKAGGKNE